MDCYNERDFETNVEEEPLLSWVVMTTQLTEAGGEYTVLIDYSLVTIVDHTLENNMINVGRMIDTGSGIFEMIKRLLSIPKNMMQPLDMYEEMVEVCEIFQMDGEGQNLSPIMMPAEILDRLVKHEHDTKENAGDLAKEHMVVEMGWSNTGVHVIVVEPMIERHEKVITNPNNKDDEANWSCVEIQGNEDWLTKY